MNPALDSRAADTSTHGTEPAVNFPRPQKGNNSQHLLVTVLGEFWRHTDHWLPVQVILRIAADVGLTRPATNTALSRLTARGVLENDRAGRRSRYRFTSQARARLQIGFDQVLAFGDPHRVWDKQWTVLSFSIPESSRAVRDMFRARLRWLGFAPLHGAVWVSPRDYLEDMREVCDSFGVDDVTVFRVHDSERRGRDLIQAWSLDEQTEKYEPFIQQCTAWRKDLAAGELTPAEVFRIRVEAMDRWRSFPWEDPDLPPELLPDTSPVADARLRFMDIFRATRTPSQHYLESVVGAADESRLPFILMD